MLKLPALGAFLEFARDSVLVARLKAAGCIVVGKTNTPELAAKGVTDNPLFGATRNPHDPARPPEPVA